jgi:(5-formylfuran-3-yl)methyl phosphate synthase
MSLTTLNQVETPARGPRLLVSVRSPQEALAAVRGGADIIDVKEPRYGSLGQASAHVITEIARLLSSSFETSRVAGAGLRLCEGSPGERRTSGVSPKAAPTPATLCVSDLKKISYPLSAALGELREPPAATELEQIVPQVGWVKVGLSGLANTDWRSRWLELQEQIPRISPQTKLIAVVYADAKMCGAPPADSVISAALSADIPGILFDTYEKGGRSLLDAVSCRELADFIATLHAAGRFVALAGSLGLSHLETVLELRPDIVAVRSAVCRGDRTSAVDADLVTRFRTALQVPNLEEKPLSADFADSHRF